MSVNVSVQGISRFVGLPTLALILCQACASAPGHPPLAASLSPSSPEWRALLQRIETQGERLTYPPGPARLLGLSPNCPMKSIDIDVRETTDGVDRDVGLVLREDGQPTAVLFAGWHLRGRTQNIYKYLASLDGRLQKAHLEVGKRDAQGKAIRGSGKVYPQDIHSRRVRKLFQRELDFWLKGMYRKPIATAASATK